VKWSKEAAKKAAKARKRKRKEASTASGSDGGSLASDEGAGEAVATGGPDGEARTSKER